MAWSVGETCYGFAGGYFGRDSYGDKTCIHVGFYGNIPYAVFFEVESGGSFSIVTGSDLDEIEEYKQPERLTLDQMRTLAKWSTKR